MANEPGEGDAVRASPTGDSVASLQALLQQRAAAAIEGAKRRGVDRENRALADGYVRALVTRLLLGVHGLDEDRRDKRMGGRKAFPWAGPASLRQGRRRERRREIRGWHDAEYEEVPGGGQFLMMMLRKNGDSASEGAAKGELEEIDMRHVESGSIPSVTRAEVDDPAVVRAMVSSPPSVVPVELHLEANGRGRACSDSALAKLGAVPGKKGGRSKANGIAKGEQGDAPKSPPKAAALGESGDGASVSRRRKKRLRDEGRDGNVKRCSVCQSDEHLRRECPRVADGSALQLPAQRGGEHSRLERQQARRDSKGVGTVAEHGNSTQGECGPSADLAELWERAAPDDVASAPRSTVLAAPLILPMPGFAGGIWGASAAHASPAHVAASAGSGDDGELPEFFRVGAPPFVEQSLEGCRKERSLKNHRKAPALPKPALLNEPLGTSNAGAWGQPQDAPKTDPWGLTSEPAPAFGKFAAMPLDEDDDDDEIILIGRLLG